MIPVFLKINSEEEAVKELKKIDVDPGGIQVMATKMLGLSLKIKSLSLKSAHIIKQEMLSLGGDAALPRGAMEFANDNVDVIVIGTLKQLRLLCQKLRMQPFGLKEIGEELSRYIEKYYSNSFLIKCPGTTLDFSRGPLIMGILNITPDSFFDGGKYLCKDDAIKHGLQLVEDGADIIDIGGESTRPGSEPVSEKEELERVLPVVKELSKRISIPISIDTYKSRVAREAIDAGAQIINDISGMRFDEKMVQVVVERDVPVVIMHIKGTPRDMQKEPYYEDVIQEILDYFNERINFAIRSGISENKIIIDPGIGFGKRLEDNINILRNLSAFKIFGRPILVGVSRKSFIGKILDLSVEERLEGTISATIHALSSGAQIIRVHDVKEMKRCIKIFNEINMI